MGPIPSLPSSGIPLAASSPFMGGETAPPRRGDPNPVELPHDRVLPADRDASPERPRDSSSAPRTPAERSEARAEEERESKPERSAREIDLSSKGMEPLHHAVTYRVHPDLERALQSARIDRDTDETVREVPSEARIQLSRAFRENLGALLDAYA
jgi:uncharacterized FlaG/YvyC family protein